MTLLSVLQMSSQKRYFSVGRYDSESHGCHRLWTAQTTIGAVQLELIWREVKDTQLVRATKSPLNLWLFEICVARALCETETPGVRPLPSLYVEQEQGREGG